MTRGKYSPTVFGNKFNGPYIYNAKGENSTGWDDSDYSEELHFANYDIDGFDSYGYSAYDADGNYVGICGGVDRNGYTEDDYLFMNDDQWEIACSLDKGISYIR